MIRLLLLLAVDPIPLLLLDRSTIGCSLSSIASGRGFGGLSRQRIITVVLVTVRGRYAPRAAPQNEPNFKVGVSAGLLLLYVCMYVEAGDAVDEEAESLWRVVCRNRACFLGQKRATELLITRCTI